MGDPYEVRATERFAGEDLAQRGPRQEGREDQVDEEALVALAAPRRGTFDAALCEGAIATSKDVVKRGLACELLGDPQFAAVTQVARDHQIRSDHFVERVTDEFLGDPGLAPLVIDVLIAPTKVG